jgi:hypothetical protein
MLNVHHPRGLMSMEGQRPAPAWKALDARQRRVLGVLLEKAATTPAAYPMTVNAIVAGCNQKSNRDPLTAYDDVDVENALQDLIAFRVASEIDWLGRVAKYKHNAYEWLGVDRTEMAVMTELLLRGAQQVGELRARAARMSPIEDLAALRRIVEGLLDRHLMIELTPPGRGQVVSHNLYSAAELAELRVRHAGRPGADDEVRRAETAPQHSTPVPAPGHGTQPSGATEHSIAELSAAMTGLRSEVARLRERLDALETVVRTATRPMVADDQKSAS